MHRRGALIGLLAAFGCGSFGAGDATPAAGDAGGPSGSEAGVSDGGVPGVGWCATNQAGAVFCDDFESDWATNDKGWDARGAISRVDRAPGDKALRVQTTLASAPTARTIMGLVKSFPKGKTHIVYSFDFQVATLTPLVPTDYYDVSLTELLFAQGAVSTVDLEHVPPGGGPLEWNLRVTGDGRQPKNVAGGAGFTGGAWHRIHVDASSNPSGDDVIGVKYDSIPSFTESPTLFAVGEDLSVVLGVDLSGPGTIDYLFDNFVIELLE